MTLVGAMAVVMFVATVDEPQFSRPIKVEAVGDIAYVANATNGSISLIDVGAKKATATHKIATSLSDLVAVPQTDTLIAVDARAGKLLTIDSSEGVPAVTGSLLVNRPSRVAVNSTGTVCAVTRQWDTRVSLVGLKPLKVLHEIELDFEPLEVLSLASGRFLIADAFGGELAIASPDGEVRQTHSIQGHNIRGLLEVENEVLISHQRLSQIARTDFSDVHWGTLMQNVLTRLKIEELGSTAARSRTVAIGDVEEGSADPGALTQLPDGRIAAVIRGADQLLVSPVPDNRGHFRFAEGLRMETGKRPVGVALSGDGQTLLVANAFGNSVSVIPVPALPDPEWDGRLSDDPTRQTTVIGGRSQELTPTERGEQAFFSAKLSHDRWLSCNSCHVDGHTNGLRADTLGDDSFGAAKLIPSLLGVADTSPWGWSGNFDVLENQIDKSIRTTMHGEVDEQTVADIGVFLRTLQPPATEVKPDIVNGRQVFTSSGCKSCHEPDQYTSGKVVDVGFTDSTGQKLFNPPSLRAIRHRRSFFHDGRAKTLDAALQLHLSSMKKDISDVDRAALKSYLLSL